MRPFEWMGQLGDLADNWQSLYDTWNNANQRYMEYWRYYSGLKLEERVDDPTSDNPPLLYPVRMNLVKLLVITQADALWGEWTDFPFSTEFYPGANNNRENDKFLSRVFQQVFDESFFGPICWEIGLDQMRFGGAVVAIRRDISTRYKVRLSRVPVFNFWPVWNPDNPSDLLEAVVAVRISPQQAKYIYGVETDSQDVIRVERWTKDTYENYVNGKKISKFSGTNIWGIVPFVYIPRFRSDNFFGEALTADVMGAQDELNMRVGDLGDHITYSAHPIKWGYNLPDDIDDTSKYPFSPDALWNLGRSLPGAEPPHLGVLESDNPVPEGALDHIKFVFDWGRHAGFSPPIAFGEDEGSQRSGATLTIRMWPLTRSARRTRLYLSSGIKQILDAVIRMGMFDKSVVDMYNDSLVQIGFAPILPRERVDIVNEVVQRLSTDPPTISNRTALEQLGERDPEAEIERIKSQLQEFNIEKDSVADRPARDIR